MSQTHLSACSGKILVHKTEEWAVDVKETERKQNPNDTQQENMCARGRLWSAQYG